MSVLIKGMEMPKICNKCDFCTYVEKDRDVWCTSTIRIIKRGITRPEYEYQDLPRPDWCPLMEVKTPHGRLFDETEVKKCLQELTDCEDKWSAIALLEWAIEKRLCIEAEDKT